MYGRFYRTVDEEQIPGASRRIFVNNGGTYFLTELVIYADGAIDCWGLMDFDELRAKLDSGWITTEPVEGGEASAHDLGGWRFSEPHSYVDPPTLLAELRDDLDQLNGRPNSVGRCLTLVKQYLADRSEPTRLAARDAYLAIPWTRRRSMLGDMDSKDFPVRALLSDTGQPMIGQPEEMTMTEEHRNGAFKYFAETANYADRLERERPANLFDDRQSPSVDIRSWPTHSVLGAEHLMPVTAFGRTYPSIAHGIFALSTSDSIEHDRIVAAKTVDAAENLAKHAPRAPDWTERRLAVMAGLLRAKAVQHPEFAEELLATGDGRIVLYSLPGDRFWNCTGTNWLGRLLEVIRSELALRPLQDAPSTVPPGPGAAAPNLGRGSLER